MGKQPLPDVLHLSTLLFVTVSEMSATFIKGEVPEHVGVTVQSSTPARGKNQIKATVLPQGGHHAVSGQLMCGVQGGGVGEDSKGSAWP